MLLSPAHVSQAAAATSPSGRVAALPPPMRRFVGCKPDGSPNISAAAAGRDCAVDCVCGAGFQELRNFQRHLQSRTHCNEYVAEVAAYSVLAGVAQSGAVAAAAAAIAASRSREAALVSQVQHLERRLAELNPACLPDRAQRLAAIEQSLQLVAGSEEGESAEAALQGFFLLFDQISSNFGRPAEGRRFGQGSGAARAAWLFLLVMGGPVVFQFWSALLDGPSLSAARKWYSEEDVAVGFSPYIHSAFQYFKDLGYDPATQLFGICFDATALKAVFRYQPKAGRPGVIIGGDYDSFEEEFTDFSQLAALLREHSPAKFVIPFVLYPLSAAAASAVRIVGVIPTLGRFPTSTLADWISEVLFLLHQAGFRHIPFCAADGDSRHRRLALDLLSPFPTFIEPASPAARLAPVELAEVLTLFPNKLRVFNFDKSESIDLTTYFVFSSDAVHWLKKWSLAPLSMARILTLGRFPVLASHLILCQQHYPAAGLLAGDVNGADRQDFGSAQRRINVCVRQELAKMPHTEGEQEHVYCLGCSLLLLTCHEAVLLARHKAAAMLPWHSAPLTSAIPCAVAIRSLRP